MIKTVTITDRINLKFMLSNTTLCNIVKVQDRLKQFNVKHVIKSGMITVKNISLYDIDFFISLVNGTETEITN